MKKLLRKVSNNTIIGLTETWLTSGNDHKLWEFDSAKCSTFRYDREHKKNIMKGGGLLLFIPNNLNPQKVNSFPETDEHAETNWVELQYNTTHGLQKLLINLSYNPIKNHNEFWILWRSKLMPLWAKKREWFWWVIII